MTAIPSWEHWDPGLFQPIIVDINGNAIPRRSKPLRNTSTPEGKKIWEEVEEAASHAPPQCEEAIKKLKEKKK